jgi:bifunctional non-homologous end joining protein LigD
MKKALRVGKVFVDWSQNDDHKTTINVYSLRAKERPTVSTPVTWKEVEQCLKKRDADMLVFTSDQTLERVNKMGDIFAPLLTLKQKLPQLGKLQGELAEHVEHYAAKLKPAPPRPSKKPSKGKAKKRG